MPPPASAPASPAGVPLPAVRSPRPGPLAAPALDLHSHDELRGLLRSRLRLLAPLLGCMLVFYLFCNLSELLDLTVARFGLFLQVVLLAVLTAVGARLYAGGTLPLRSLRTLELILFGLTATSLAWLQCGSVLEALALGKSDPRLGGALLRLALGSAAGRWLLLIAAYGIAIPNTRRRGGVVLGTLVLMPVVLTLTAGLAQPASWPATVRALVPLIVVLSAGGALALFACTRLGPGGEKGDWPREEEGLAPSSPAQLVGPYLLRSHLRSGGMADVYLAEHAVLRRPCALKLIRPEQARDRDVRHRFEREARALAALRHPNAVAIYDCGRADDGRAYYVMEYLAGLSLAELAARDGPLPPARVVHLLLQLCGVVGEAHACGFLHLDIKPGNVIVGRSGAACDVAKLLDFGLARELAAGTLGLSSWGEEPAAGSPQYMAPEQAAGAGPLDPRADVYGLGGVAYFLLTGRPPFDCDGALQLVMAHAYDPVTPPSRLRPEVPDDLEAVVLRCLEKEPAQRFAGANELSRALAECACAGQWDARHAAAAWQRDGDTPMPLPAVKMGE